MEEQIIVGLSSEVLVKIDALAQKLGMTVEQIWPWMIRQQYTEAIWPAILFVIFFISALYVCRFIKKVNWDEYKLSVEQVIGIIGGIIAVFGLVISFTNFIAEFSDIFNPEYWALKDLMRMIK